MSQPWNPEERLVHGIASIRGISSRFGAESALAEIEARVIRRAARRSLRLVVSVSAVAVTGLGAGIMFLPVRIKPLDIDMLTSVVEHTKEHQSYYQAACWNEKQNGFESLSVTETWQLPHETIVRTQERHAAPGYDPKDTLASKPIRETNRWTGEDGKVVCYEPMFHYAVKYGDGRRPYKQLAMTLDSLLSGSTLVSSNRNVWAHGGGFDRYVMDTGPEINGTQQTVYVDPKENLVRFIDAQPHDGNRGFVSSVQYAYGSPESLAQEAPKLPPAVPVVTADALRKKFEREIQTPISVQTIGGVKVSLYGVVIRSPGDVRVITSGGAPRDPKDPHQMIILGVRTGFFRDQPARVGHRLTVRDPRRDGRKTLMQGPETIAGKPYVIETSNRCIIDPAPRQISLLVPIWKYDRSRNFVSTYGQVYGSKFVGYASLTTSKIYEMPAGVGYGFAQAELPSEYPSQTLTPASKDEKSRMGRNR